MEKRAEDFDPDKIGVEEKDQEEKSESHPPAGGESKEPEESEDERSDERFVSEEVESETEEPRKFFHSSGSSQIYAGPNRSSKKIPFLLGILVIILILGGLFYFLSVRPKTLEEPSPSPGTFVEESSPQSSPTPSFDRSKHTLRVLNGTKTQGLAASTSAKLKELGYQIEKTGNATNSAFLKTVVRVKPDLEELLENLLKDLGALDFEGEEGPELKDLDSSDGEVILGAE